jgi:hypothetical protein
MSKAYTICPSYNRATNRAWTYDRDSAASNLWNDAESLGGLRSSVAASYPLHQVMIRPIDGNDRIRLKLPFMSGALNGCYVPDPVVAE